MKRKIKKAIFSEEKSLAILVLMGIILSFCFVSEASPFSLQEKKEPEIFSSAADRISRTYFVQVGQDFLHLLVAPRNWRGHDIMNLAAVFGTGTVFFTLDQDIFNWVAERRSDFSSDLSRIFTRAGDGAWLFAFCGAIYCLGEVMKKPDWRRTALLSLESLAISSVSVATLKFLVGRARPHAWEGSQSFHPLSTSQRFTSFPSGHASAAFSVAASIASETNSQTIDILAYSLATLAALSRVHDEAHWASDVLVGSAIGYFIGRGVVNLHRPEKERLALIVYPVRKGIAASVFFSLN